MPVYHAYPCINVSTWHKKMVTSTPPCSLHRVCALLQEWGYMCCIWCVHMWASLLRVILPIQFFIWRLPWWVTYVYAIISMIAIVDMNQSRCTSQQCAVHFGQVNKYLYYKHTYSCIVCGVSLVSQCLSCHFVQGAVPNIYPVLCLEEDC